MTQETNQIITQLEIKKVFADKANSNYGTNPMELVR